ncbi:penicillin-binding transpeptidase domain-containing protein [Patulibacter sp. NPDC049589]|uniref:penicillin-binding transpeptidase domain-containing protein n=1 Tax=Patulibacter sp. NPDC049589 TaxID=3154731 RepID=UPI003442AC05
MSTDRARAAAGRGAPAGRRPPSRRRPRPVRIASVLVILLAAVAVYVLLDGRATRNAERDVVARYLSSWETNDPAAMYGTIDAAARGRLDQGRFTRLVRGALDTATVRSITTGELRRDGRTFTVPVALRTRVFGVLRSTMSLAITGQGDDARVDWSRRLTFPGLRDGETLKRTTQMPPRATILARDGTVLAQGPARTSPMPGIADQVRGLLGPADPADAALMRRLGVPPGAKVGTSGLERVLNPQLVGIPGGTLTAGDRTVARAAPKQGPAVRSSISPAVVKAAALAQQDAPDVTGTTVIDTRTGEVLAFQGSAWRTLQAPGSTMKIVTAAAALEDGLATTGTEYPIETEAKDYGIQNSNNEPCGGTLVQSFAMSCNSVFVPLGAELGPKRLVDMAERFGFNRTPTVPGAVASVIPPAAGMTDGQAAISAIGQLGVRATSLQVALMAATIAADGRQPTVTFLKTDAPAPTRRVITLKTAAAMRQLMAAVVSDGTGKDARVTLPGITTAGKTGTAELATTQGEQCDQQQAAKKQPDDITTAPEPPSPCGNADGKSTTAWMAAFAPITPIRGRSPIAVGVMRARNFQGGATAAPVARDVLTAALR